MELELLLEKKICQLVERALDSALSQKKSSQEAEPAPKEWLTLKELLDYDPLKRKKSTFYRYVNKRQIPFEKMGKNLVFPKAKIDEWFTSFIGLTQSEIDQKIDKSLSGKG